jgi:paraquat-inducible protein B
MKEANPKLIGVFVIGGLALLVAALVIFSSQDLFAPKRIFVAYFQQSINGLNIGAPVRFRGIPLGEVLEIEGVFDPQTGNMIPRVVLEIRPESMENAVLEDGEYTLLRLLLDRGVRASLKSASLLTGQLYVALDFHPNVPERYLGSGAEAYPEMPTIDSGFDEALAKLSELPIEEVILRVSSAFSAAEDLMRNPHIAELLAVLPKLVKDADTTVVDLRQFINRDLTDAAQNASQALVVVRKSMQSLSDSLNEETLVQVESTLIELESTLQLVSARLEANDPLMYELITSLQEIGDAARSVRDLADALEEHPESLLRGKTQ